MKVLTTSMEQFLATARQKFSIPDYKFERTKDMDRMIQAYSNSSANGRVRANFYVALYYMVQKMIAEGKLDISVPVRVFTTTAEEDVRFQEAYRAYATGPNLVEAREKMKPLADQGHLEAIRCYIELLDHTVAPSYRLRKPYEEKLKEMGDPLETENLPGIIALCFECNTHAIYRLLKDYYSSPILYTWMLTVYSREMADIPKNGKAMMELYQIYSEEPYENPGYARYWLEEALHIHYGPAEIIEASRAMEDWTCGNWTYEVVQRGTKHAKRALAAGMANANTTYLGFFSKAGSILSQMERAEQMRREREAQEELAEYQKKLDARETMFNWVSQGTPWTDKDDFTYGMLSGDQDRIERGVASSAARGYLERDFVKKRVAKKESEEGLSSLYADTVDERPASVVQQLPGQTGEELGGSPYVLVPPLSPEVESDEVLAQLYQTFLYRMSRELFFEARRTAEEMVEQYPNCYTAHWARFLAKNGIQFVCGYEVFNICHLSIYSYRIDKDVKWIQAHTNPEECRIFDAYFHDFEERREEQISDSRTQAGKSQVPKRILLCYDATPQEDGPTKAQQMAEILRNKPWETCVKKLSYVVDGKICEPLFKLSNSMLFTPKNILDDEDMLDALNSSVAMVLLAERTEELLDPLVINPWVRYMRGVSRTDGFASVVITSKKLMPYFRQHFPKATLFDIDQVADMEEPFRLLAGRVLEKESEVRSIQAKAQEMGRKLAGL